MRNFKIVLQYEGTRYKGWQKQGGTNAGRREDAESSDSSFLETNAKEYTIQGKLERLLSRIAGEPVEIHGSGRTDAGVHAYGQIASFHMDTKLTAEALMEKINSYLPEDIAVISIEEVPDRFHARLGAKGKTYRYRVLNSSVPHIFERRYVWQVPEKLDVQAMCKAASYLEGTHDFKAFTSTKKGKKSTVRTIEAIEIVRCGDEIHFTFRGNGFLFHMVRILVGTLIETGKKNRRPEEMPAILESGLRENAGPLAPACGLALMEVSY